MIFARKTVQQYLQKLSRATPTPGGDCCSVHSGASCDNYACASCVCGSDSDCCSLAWDEFCLNIVGRTCGTNCGCGPTPAPTPQPTETPRPTATGATPTATSTFPPTRTPGGDCCVAHAGPGCDSLGCQSCVCQADSFCCEILWDQSCSQRAAADCQPNCPCAPATNTAAPTPIPCTGDCNASHDVTVDEILTMVNIALGNVQLPDCEAADASHDGQVTVDEILAAVNNALNGCVQTA